jgi:hypothetical protein
MSWQDRLFNWVDQQIERHPEWDSWLETHLHQHGLHGPQARHLLKTVILPDAMLAVAILLLLIAALVLWRIRRRARGRRADGHAPAGELSGS